MSARREDDAVRRTPALAVTAAAALLLTACTGGADDPTSPGPTGPSGGSAGEASSAPEAVPAEPLPPATAECLAGTWRLDLAAMQDDLAQLFAAADDDAVEVTVSGTSTYEFEADGSFAATVDSTSGMTMRSDETELTSRSESSGDLTGAWSLDGDRLTISDVDSSGLDVTTTAEMDGETLDVPPGAPEDAIEALPPTLSTATCSDDTLVLAADLTQDEGGDPVTISYTLRR
ncbi:MULTISPECIES: lipocalin family protein [Cellulomonas]|uniref:lipocalin family protein n=1 Tax=Cellulomonas TaxID=1707 RepID=UPI00128CDCBE|nr:MULTISPECIES: lipocalin family protein [Cellulomonas]